MGKKLGAFLAGGLAGAAIALLYAPRSGRETRAMVADKVNVAWNEAQEMGTQASASAQQMYQDATARGQEVVQGVTAKGQELYGAASARVQEAAGNIKPVFAERNDELREKIEAARQRIAAQVAKNAEQAHDAVTDTIPVAADAAEEVADAAADAASDVAEQIAGETDTEVPVDKGPQAVEPSAENAEESTKE